MDNEKRILEINKKINILTEKLSKKNNDFDFVKSNSFADWELYQEPELSLIEELSREKRLIIPYKLSKISDLGNVMSLNEFIENVNDGGFIDYDGYGNYIMNNQKTDIVIYPSDVRNDSIRYEFDTIIWFNR